MALLKSVLEKIGVRLNRHDAEIEELKRQLAETKGRLEDYEGRLEKIEDTVEKVVGAFEERYASLAKRTAGARDQQKKALAEIRREIDAFIQIVELSAEAQMDEARRRRVAKLLRNARTKRTRLDNLLNGNAAA
jgi:chromosome segregation ATPase